MSQTESKFFSKCDFSKRVINESLDKMITTWEFPRFDRYDQALKKNGYPMETIYQNLRIDSKKFPQIRSGVSAQDLLNIFDAIVNQTQDTRLGVKLANMRAPRQMGTRFYISFFSKTLRSALKDFLFFSALEIPLLKIEIEEGNEDTEIRFEYSVNDPAITFEIDIDIITIVNLIRELLILPGWSPIVATTKFTMDPGRQDALSAVIRCPIVQKKTKNSIIFPSKTLDFELKSVDLLAKKIMTDEFYRNLDKSFSGINFVLRSDYYIAKYYEHYEKMVDLETVASSFSMSETHYQRALSKEGKNFRKIRADFVFKIACALIGSGVDYSIVANHLGYSGVKSFSRFMNGHSI